MVNASPVRPTISGVEDGREAGDSFEGEVKVDEPVVVAQVDNATRGQGARDGARDDRDGAVDEQELGERRPKPGRQPRGPTQAEIDEH